MRAGDEFSRDPKRPRRERRRSAGRVPRDDRRAMRDFIRSRTGVEAYVEPRTLDQPLTVALVAADGEWLRFTLSDERFLQSFAREHALPVYDAGRVGYPRRMKEYRRGGEGEPDPEHG